MRHFVNATIGWVQNAFESLYLEIAYIALREFNRECVLYLMAATAEQSTFAAVPLMPVIQLTSSFSTARYLPLSYAFPNILSSSSSCTISTDIPDPFSTPFSIVHCFRHFFRAASRIDTELLYIGFSWSSCLFTSM